MWAPCISNQLFGDTDADTDAAGPGTAVWERHLTSWAWRRSPGILLTGLQVHSRRWDTHVETALCDPTPLWGGENTGLRGARVLAMLMVRMDQIYETSVQLS